MKPFIFTISIYFLCLALPPCNCNIQAMISLQNKTEQLSSTHSEKYSECEICNPFSACSSFHNLNFIIKNSSDLLKFGNIPFKMISINNQRPVWPHLDSFWKPSKIKIDVKINLLNTYSNE